MVQAGLNATVRAGLQAVMHVRFHIESQAALCADPCADSCAGICAGDAAEIHTRVSRNPYAGCLSDFCLELKTGPGATRFVRSLVKVAVSL